MVAVVPNNESVNVTYFHDKLTTVEAKAVLMCTAKYITSRLVTGIPQEQKAAMHHTRYAPYPVVNVIFDKPVYNRGYDNWCPGNTFTDFIVADWTVRGRPDYKQKNNILTFYTPLPESKRHTLLEADDCKHLAARVLADFQKLMPEFDRNPVRSAHLSPRTSNVHGHTRTIHAQPNRGGASHGPHIFWQRRLGGGQNLLPANPFVCRKPERNGRA